MSLIYVTGAPGVGKTTLQKVIHECGYETHDIDNPRLGGPHNKITGKRATIPSAHVRTPDWFEKHEWRIYPRAFERLRDESKTKDIILFGVAESDSEILHVFDKIMYLKIDDNALTYRLSNREGNDYGKNDFEKNEILNRKRILDEKYSSLDVIFIDAKKSIDELSKQIISHI